MAINPHDDYEALAKLLYPSIEASGNVYYGQTRKLTMDEVLNKNELGFESHIERDANSDTGYFCWKVGPLSHSFKLNISTIVDYSCVTNQTFNNYALEFNPEYSSDIVYTVYYAKYRLIKESNVVVTNVSSGEFNSYESNLNLDLQSITVCRDKLHGGCNFYIDGDYLYVLILEGAPYRMADSQQQQATPSSDNQQNNEELDSAFVDEMSEYNYEEEFNSPFTLKNCGVTSSNITFYRYVWGTSTTAPPPSVNTYKYKINGSPEWVPFEWRESRGDNVPTLDYMYTAPVTLSPGDHIQIICTNFVGNSPYYDSRYHHLSISGNNIYAYGNICSLMSENFTNVTRITWHALYSLLSSNTGLVRAPLLPATEFEEKSCFNLFSGCTSLKIVPDILITESDDTGLAGVFSGCTSLIRAGNITLSSDSTIDISRIFTGCTSLLYGSTITINRGTVKLTSESDGANYGIFHDSGYLESVTINGSFDSIELDDSLSNSYWNGSLVSGVLYISPYYESNLWDTIIPLLWVVKTYSTYKFNESHIERLSENNIKQDYMIAYGKDNSANGRGLLSESTLSNMETSFDENGTHQMNTYNADGSYNQEIWGYKSFNSPVQFRNGIYGDTFSITSGLTDGIRTVNISPHIRVRSNIYFGKTNNKYIGCTSDGTTGEALQLNMHIPVIPQLPEKPNYNPNGEIPLGNVTLIYVEAFTYKNFGAQENNIGKRYHDRDDSYTLYCSQSASYTSKIYSVKISSDGKLEKNRELTNRYFVGLTDGMPVSASGDGFFVLAVEVSFSN